MTTKANIKVQSADAKFSSKVKHLTALQAEYRRKKFLEVWAAGSTYKCYNMPKATHVVSMQL